MRTVFKGTHQVKHNPYKMVEYSLIGLLVAAMLAAVAYIITVTESWKGVGWTVLVIVLIIVGFALVEEWNQRKRLWDVANNKNRYRPAESDKIELDINR